MARDLTRREGGLSPFGDRLEPFDLWRGMSRWDPFRELERMLRTTLPTEEAFVPSFDVKESKDAYEIKADLPGVSEEDVDVSLSGNRLTISGKREREKKEEDDTWYAVERSYGSFTRSFTLPEGLDEERCEATYDNGVLTVRLLKSEEEQPKRIKLLGKNKKRHEEKDVTPEKGGKKSSGASEKNA